MAADREEAVWIKDRLVECDVGDDHLRQAIGFFGIGRSSSNAGVREAYA